MRLHGLFIAFFSRAYLADILLNPWLLGLLAWLVILLFYSEPLGAFSQCASGHFLIGVLVINFPTITFLNGY